MAAPPEACACGRGFPGIAGSNPALGHGYFSLVTFMLSSRVLWVGLIARPEGSYRAWFAQWV
jgi:hypothetical protein